MAFNENPDNAFGKPVIFIGEHIFPLKIPRETLGKLVCSLKTQRKHLGKTSMFDENL